MFNTGGYDLVSVCALLILDLYESTSVVHTFLLMMTYRHCTYVVTANEMPPTHHYQRWGRIQRRVKLMLTD